MSMIFYSQDYTTNTKKLTKNKNYENTIQGNKQR